MKRQANRKGKGKGKAAKARKAARRAAQASTPAPERSGGDAAGGAARGGDATGRGVDTGDGDVRGAGGQRAPAAARSTASARRGTPRPDNASRTGGTGGFGGPDRSGTASGSSARADTDVAAPLARFFLWADSPRAVQRLIVGLGALCAVLFLFDTVWHRHAYVPGEGLWGFHAIAGFVSFTLIVLGAKALRTVIGRDENYYGAAAIDGEDYPERGLGRVAAAEGEGADELLRVRDGHVVGERR